MPFNIVKFKRGFRVEDDKGNAYSKSPMTKKRAREQQKALYASESERKHLSGSGYASYMDGNGKYHILLQGDGFFGDVWTKVKSTASNVISKVAPKIISTASKIVSKGVRNNYPPKARQTLAKYGNGTVYRIEIIREPIQSTINKALNFITAGKFNQAKKKFNYDNLFHLSMIAFVATPNGDKVPIKIEKNEVINITDKLVIKSDAKREGVSSGLSQHSSGQDAESIPVPVRQGLTLQQMMDTAQKEVGADFFKYDAFTNNCQNFIINILRANDLSTPKVETFVLQPVEGLLKELPSFTSPLASLVTNVAGVADRVIQGEGMVLEAKGGQKKKFR